MEAGGKVVGTIPQALPSFALPRFDFQRILEFLTAAIFISLIGFMEAISIAKAMAARTRQRLDPNQELIGQGLSNMVGSMFGSYAVSGSFSRSAVNISSGAQTGFSSVVTGIVVAIALLFFTPLLYHLPLATLAAVIMMAVIGLVNVKPIVHAWKTHIHDGLAAVVTFVFTLVLAPHVETGIIVGVLLASALFLYRSMKPRVAELSMSKDGTYRDVVLNNLDTCEEISLLRWDGSLYFANVSYFEDQIFDRLGNRPNLKYIIVDAEGINQLDATGEQLISSLFEEVKVSGVTIFVARAKRQILDTLRRTGAMERIGEHHFFPRVQLAINQAWEELGDDHSETCPLSRQYAESTT
jgi:SulP family sulfate permease